MTAERHRQFAAVPDDVPERPVVGFVGTFDPRKGMCEFPDLVDRVVSQVPGATFRLLGTAGLVRDADGVRRYFPRRLRSLLEIWPRYEPNELPGLLTGVSIGVFPSRVESFGYGVLEMLAASIPVFAFDAPGPNVMLSSESLVPVGGLRNARISGDRTLRRPGLVCGSPVGMLGAKPWNSPGSESVSKPPGYTRKGWRDAESDRSDSFGG